MVQIRHGCVSLLGKQHKSVLAKKNPSGGANENIWRSPDKRREIDNFFFCNIHPVPAWCTAYSGISISLKCILHLHQNDCFRLVQAEYNSCCTQPTPTESKWIKSASIKHICIIQCTSQWKILVIGAWKSVFPSLHQWKLILQSHASAFFLNQMCLANQKQYGYGWLENKQGSGCSRPAGTHPGLH